MNISKVIFEKPKKMLKNSRLGQLLAKISWPTEFFSDMRFLVVNSKHILVLFELGTFNYRIKREQKIPLFSLFGSLRVTVQA